jgi:hypothetical protein
MRTIVRIIRSGLEKTFWNLVRIRNPSCCAFARRTHLDSALSGIARRKWRDWRWTMEVQRTHVIE